MQLISHVHFPSISANVLSLLLNKSDSLLKSEVATLSFHLLFQIVEAHHVMLPQKIDKITSKAVTKLRQAGKKVKK